MASKLAPYILHGHWVSQPFRSVAWLCKLSGIPFEHVKIQPMNGDCKKAEYVAKFNTGLSPGLEDGDFKLCEGTAIAQYLCEKHDLQHYYPTAPDPASLKSRAVINSYLASHHSTSRSISAVSFRPLMLKVMNPTKFVFDEEKCRGSANKLVDKFAASWLRGPTSTFIGGHTSPTLADLFAYPEISQMRQLGICKEFGAEDSHIEVWLKNMREIPHHDDMHRSVFTLAGAAKKALEVEVDETVKFYQS